jgi:hypothetical protein
LIKKFEMRYFLLLGAMLLFFSACKEDEPVDPCTNGFLDPGEIQPDCGGNCTPCPSSVVSYLTMSVNGTQTSVSTKTLEYDGNAWTLQLANDTFNIQLSLGTTGLIATEPIPSAGSFCYRNGIQYAGQEDGIYSISDHDTSADLMSGFFQITFFRPGLNDTLRITNGQFENFGY